MFNALQLDKRVEPPAKKSSLTENTDTSTDRNDHTEQNIQNLDFLDFVPTENNAQDFDLNSIIQKIDQEEKAEKKTTK